MLWIHFARKGSVGKIPPVRIRGNASGKRTGKSNGRRRDIVELVGLDGKGEAVEFRSGAAGVPEDFDRSQGLGCQLGHRIGNDEPNEPSPVLFKIKIP